eukprot:6473159-Amphidinium_carterae.1
MEVDQGASLKATSEADQSDMTPMEYGGLAITASAAGIRQSREYTFAMIQQQEYLMGQWIQRRDLVEAGSARHNDLNERIALSNRLINLFNQALAEIHQYAPAASSTTEAEQHP